MTDLTKIKWLHVEATTRCNAHCPACPRNNNGFGVVDFLTIQDLDINRFVEVLDMLPNLNSVQFCGNYGDAISAKNINDLIDIVVERKLFFQLHTNGSLKTIKWWTNLANKLKNINHNVWFALDGLEDTHSVYRQGTNFNKIIENATAFITAGGTATWQFIPFQHNQHQLKQCIALSRKLKFKDFKIVKSSRTPEFARHYITGEEYEIKPFQFNKNYNNRELSVSLKTVTIDDCMHLNLPSLYLNANGILSLCCYLRNIDYLNTSFANGILSNHPARICIDECGSKK